MEASKEELIVTETEMQSAIRWLTSYRKATAKLSAEAALDGFDFDEPVTALTEAGELHMLFFRQQGKPLSFLFTGDGKALAMFDADFDDALEMDGLPRVLTEAERAWIGERLAATGFLRSDKGPTGGWFDVAACGSYYDGPIGPWRGLDETYLALADWVKGKGLRAGNIMKACSFRVLGPFTSPAEAREAGIWKDLHTGKVVPVPDPSIGMLGWSEVVDHAAERGILLGRG